MTAKEYCEQQGWKVGVELQGGGDAEFNPYWLVGFTRDGMAVTEDRDGDTARWDANELIDARFTLVVPMPDKAQMQRLWETCNAWVSDDANVTSSVLARVIMDIRDSMTEEQ